MLVAFVSDELVEMCCACVRLWLKIKRVHVVEATELLQKK
jgi:hypothetical protein